MLPIALPSSLLALSHATLPVQLLVLAIFCLLVASSIRATRQIPKPGDAPWLPQFSLFNIVPFYRRRFDFLNWGFYVTGSSVFQFKLLQVRNTRCS